MTEADLQSAVIEAARYCGWLVHHCRPAVNPSGRWATPITGNRGFPDLVLVHKTRGLLFVELKSAVGQCTDEQDEWLDLLSGYAETVVWRPKNFDEIVHRLRSDK